VVDAGDASPALPESAVWGLGSALERLSPTMAYLPARGLPRRCIDVHGSSACLIDELTRVMPQADALLIHAGPMDLVRMLKGHVLRPVIACGGDLDAVKEAYATVKLLAQRLGWVTFDLLVLSGRGDVPAHRIADALAQCAERHAGCTLRTWTVIDPQVDPRREPDAALQALAVSHLCEPKVDGVFAVASETPQPAGTPRRRTSSASLASTRSH
jgi:hypothetical protein